MELVAERPKSSRISGNAVLLFWLLIIFSRFQCGNVGNEYLNLVFSNLEKVVGVGADEAVY